MYHTMHDDSLSITEKALYLSHVREFFTQWDTFPIIYHKGHCLPAHQAKSRAESGGQWIGERKPHLEKNGQVVDHDGGIGRGPPGARREGGVARGGSPAGNRQLAGPRAQLRVALDACMTK